MKNLHSASDDELHADLLEARRLIQAELSLLLDSFDPQLVQYVTITAAIRLGQDMGQSPPEFCQKVAEIVGLYCGDKPGGAPSVMVIEFPEGE